MTSIDMRCDIPAVGLSVGSSTLAAVGSGRAVTVRPLVRRAGQPVGDFVDRVGDPVGIVAADGSLHSGAELLAEALLALARGATAGRPLQADAVVAYPGSWGPSAAEALRRALLRLPPWSEGSARLDVVPDCLAALAGLAAVGRDLPVRGVVAVCDFGAGGTTVTLVDLDGPGVVGTPLRIWEFAGEAIDRALLTHVLAAAGHTPGSTGTSAIAALNQLRSECRAAKERLSAHTVTMVPGRVAGLRGNVRLTRSELEELIRAPLSAVSDSLQELLQRNGIAPVELAAVVSVGGGAAIPAVTTTLSQRFRVRVITPPRPALAAAAGAARWATAQGGESVTVPIVVDRGPAPAALAWSLATDIPELAPPADGPGPAHPVRAVTRPRPDPTPEPKFGARVPIRWYQQPVALAAAVLMVIAGAGGAAALALRSDAVAVPASTTGPPVNPVEVPAAAAPPEHGDPGPRTVVAVPPG